MPIGEPRRLHLADGTSQPLADYTMEEIVSLANGDVAARGQRPADIGTFRQLRDEMEHFGAKRVGDLNTFTVTTYEVMLGIRTPIEGLEP